MVGSFVYLRRILFDGGFLNSKINQRIEKRKNNKKTRKKQPGSEKARKPYVIGLKYTHQNQASVYEVCILSVLLCSSGRPGFNPGSSHTKYLKK